MASTHAPTEPILYSFPAADDVISNLAAFILKAQFEAIDKHKRFTIALSGGSLPKMLRGLIGAQNVEWEKWHVFFADERVVPLDHPDSNYKLCNDELFSKIPIPQKNIYRIKREALLEDNPLPQGVNPDKHIDDLISSFTPDPEEELQDPLDVIADEYSGQLIGVFTNQTHQGNSARFPVFDLIMLGMGPDGHTASLFPEHPLLIKGDEWVASIRDSPKPPRNRITFTLPVINHAARVAFVATGAGKQDILAKVLDKPEDGLPASRVRPTSPGAVYWFVDDAAAEKVVYKRTSFKL